MGTLRYDLTSAQANAAQYRTPSNLNARAAIYRFGTDPTPWPRWVFDQLLELGPVARVLEIGCGHGALWRANRDRLPAGWDVTLADQSAGMLAAAGDLGFEVLRADAQALPVADGLFDAVVANHMLYHCSDRPRALGEIRRVLRPGGKLFAATNSIRHMRQIVELSRRFYENVGELFKELPFSLENGAQQLRPIFRAAELRERKGELRVTEADAVVNYVLSVGESAAEITGAKVATLRAMVQEQIDAAGAFICTTATGLFVATS